MFNVLVLGGTGFVGRSVCEKLVERSGGANGWIRVPTRRIASAKHIQLLPTVQVVAGDVHDDATLVRLMRGADAVINLVAMLHGSEAEFTRAHVKLAERIGVACHQADVRRVIHVSALGVGSQAPSLYLRSKAAGEAALKAANLDLTILRPSVIFGEHDRFLNLFAELQAVFPFMPLGGADARFQPVWVDDVATAITRCLDDPSTIGETLECTGPSVYTLRELVHMAGAWSGRERPVFGLPAAVAKLQAFTMELLPGKTLLSRDNLDSMKVANVASGALPGLERLGIVASPLESVAPRYLGRGHGPSRLEPWRARARRD